MKWSTAIFGVVLCLCALEETGVQGQTVPTDASPGEFPYVVNLNLLHQPNPFTVPGLVVSDRYILTSNNAYANGNVSNMQIIDQMGVVRTPVKIKLIVSSKFTYVKFCNTFRGAKYPMTASVFNDLSTNASATLIWFNGTSPVLRKVAAIAHDSTTCDSLLMFNYASKKICMKQDDTPGICKLLIDDILNPTYNWHPVFAINNGQVQGVSIYRSCSSNGDMNGPFHFDNIHFYRNDIINAIPSVSIK
ncbi:Hypothetical predicted protein [Cloeon dipterum]|uniref:Peptidase S1 domain-containing protein n=1 Tax=Cloeon dipterum TaxID=197152 RepID=A0A8S1BX93_9INSE|nr:Hypothetical predicted protein [Cloeon dipterum]